MIFLGIWLGINVLAALVFLLTGIGCLRPNRRPGYCRRPGCGHAEEDHETEEDNGFRYHSDRFPGAKIRPLAGVGGLSHDGVRLLAHAGNGNARRTQASEVDRAGLCGDRRIGDGYRVTLAPAGGVNCCLGVGRTKGPRAGRS